VFPYSYSSPNLVRVVYIILFNICICVIRIICLYKIKKTIWEFFKNYVQSKTVAGTLKFELSCIVNFITVLMEICNTYAIRLYLKQMSMLTFFDLKVTYGMF